MCKSTGRTVVAPTKKGARVWLQGLESLGWTGGTRYNVEFHDGFVTLSRNAEGKRKVTPSKGGVIDLESKKVAQVFEGCTQVAYHVNSDTINVFKETLEG